MLSVLILGPSGGIWREEGGGRRRQGGGRREEGGIYTYTPVHIHIYMYIYIHICGSRFVEIVSSQALANHGASAGV